ERRIDDAGLAEIARVGRIGGHAGKPDGRIAAESLDSILVAGVSDKFHGFLGKIKRRDLIAGDRRRLNARLRGRKGGHDRKRQNGNGHQCLDQGKAFFEPVFFHCELNTSCDTVVSRLKDDWLEAWEPANPETTMITSG